MFNFTSAFQSHEIVHPLQPGGTRGQKERDYYTLLKVVGFVAEVIHRTDPVVFYDSPLSLSAPLVFSIYSLLSSLSFPSLNLHPPPLSNPLLPAFPCTLFTFSFGYFPISQATLRYLKVLRVLGQGIQQDIVKEVLEIR